MGTLGKATRKVLKAIGYLDTVKVSKDDAELLETCADEMFTALFDYLEWLSEPDARLKSGRSRDYFRAHFAEWQALKMAEMRGRTRHFRSVIVPQRAHASAAKLAGFRGERAG